MSFPLGKPILAMLAIAILSGAAIVARPEPVRADLRVWTFAESHARTYREPSKDGTPSLADQFRRLSGKTAGVELVASGPLNIRLASIFMSQSAQGSVPDLVEVDIGAIGQFFRPNVDEIGFLPLNDFLQASGRAADIIPSRLATWSKNGVVFGIPHDVHPVTITYRKDLFDAAGVDLAHVKTWSEFVEASLRYQDYSRVNEHPERFAMELPSSATDVLSLMLQQRGVALIEDDISIHLSDPKVAPIIAFYAQLVAGPKRIGIDSTRGAGRWTQDLSRGDFAAAVTPDWRIDELRTGAPELAGKLAMIPLPRFEPTDAPTAAWGGTMIGIPRGCHDPDASWKLLEFLYLSPESARARVEHSSIVPAVTSHWSQPTYHAQDPFFGGQRVGELYIDLARQVPRVVVTPYMQLGWAQLSIVQGRAIDYFRTQGNAGLEEQCQVWLNDGEAELERWVRFGKRDE